MSVADWLGIAGFVLSLLLAVLELYRSSVNVRIVVVRLYPMFGDSFKQHIFLDAIVENHSSLPIGISQIEMSFHDFPNDSVATEHGERIVLSATFQGSENLPSVHEELSVTPLPINLNPHESREIKAVFRVQSPSLQEFLRQIEERIHREGLVNDIRVRFCLSTSRRVIHSEVLASFHDFAIVQRAFDETMRMHL